MIRQLLPIVVYNANTIFNWFNDPSVTKNWPDHVHYAGSTHCLRETFRTPCTRFTNYTLKILVLT